jgi:hypothetical protein
MQRWDRAESDLAALRAQYDSLAQQLAAANALVERYQFAAQHKSADAEVWHELRMQMDAALGPTVDPYIRADSFTAQAELIRQRDAANARADAAETGIRTIHQKLKRGENTQDHGAAGNFDCIIDHLNDMQARIATQSARIAAALLAARGTMSFAKANCPNAVGDLDAIISALTLEIDPTNITLVQPTARSQLTSTLDDIIDEQATRIARLEGALDEATELLAHLNRVVMDQPWPEYDALNAKVAALKVRP